MRVGSAFSGIGGFEVACEKAGMECVWQVEKDEQCRRVLEHHWPGMRRGDDISTFDPDTVDLVVGGWPCQGNSVAGKRGGMADPRSGLFHELVRVLDKSAARWFFGDAGSQGRQDFETENFVVGTLGSKHTAKGHGAAGVKVMAFKESQSGVRQGDTHTTLDSNKGSRRQEGVVTPNMIRRLTPTECLRLQSFPDDWLDLKPPLSDSAKYRMCGNAVAPAQVFWIAERLAKCES